jgi:TonB family protein
MRRTLFVMLAMVCAAAAFADEPLMVRVAVFQRVPRLTGDDVPLPQVPDGILAAPAGGWPSSIAALRQAISARRKGRNGVFISDLESPKPLTADEGAAFFLPDIEHAVQVKANGDVLLPNGKHTTMPIAAGSTAVLGAPDEMYYVALTLLKPADVADDTMVIFHGQKPLGLVARVEPKIPPVESMRNQTGNVMTQLRIEPDGSVGDVTVLQKVQPEIDAAIVDAFKQWRFQPPVRDGKPATAYMVMSMNYRVN